LSRKNQSSVLVSVRILIFDCFTLVYFVKKTPASSLFIRFILSHPWLLFTPSPMFVQLLAIPKTPWKCPLIPPSLTSFASVQALSLSRIAPDDPKTVSCALPQTRYVTIMDWQQIAALGIVGATAMVFLWAKLRPRKFSFEKDTHCGCGSNSGPANKTSIVFSARKGQRPKILVKQN
jgi:hypothetical protein